MANARAYEADTVVVDVEEPTPVSVGRVPTRDLIMHCRDEHGKWHRLHPNQLKTACGQTFTAWQTGNVRSGRYPDHPLAECECWTTAERTEADDRKNQRWKP
jgi:hypothetical protein